MKKYLVKKSLRRLSSKDKMPYEFRFPDVGEGITEGEIVKWKVKTGDKIEADQPLVEIETDKAVVDIPSPKAGIILQLNGKESDTIKVGDILVIIGELGEKVQPQKDIEKKDAPQPEVKKEFQKSQQKKEERYTGSVVGFLEEAPLQQKKETKYVEAKKIERTPIKALPKVRALAEKLNIDLKKIKGTGPEGRITEEDVRKSEKQAPQEKIAEAKVTRKYDMFGYIDRVPLKGIRKSISTHIENAHLTTAPVTNMIDADVTSLFWLREKEKKIAEAKKVHLTFIPFVMKAVIVSLKKHPLLNASLEGEEIIIKKYYNISIAVDTENGLIVPVVKGANEKDIFQLAEEIQSLAEKARIRKLDLMDVKGGCFTITNLGTFGTRYFTPIINYPESAILGMGKIEDKLVIEENKTVIRKILPLSLTYDHRIIDGAEAAKFLNDLKDYLEDPATIFMEEH